MRKAKIKIIKFYNVIIAGMLSILGFTTSCDPVVEYGTPYANFIVKGKITSFETDKPIENIQVTMGGVPKLTNSNGEFEIVNSGSLLDTTFNLNIRDIDGENNLLFFDKDTVAQFKNPIFSGGDDNWYVGDTKINIDIKLKPKK